LNTLAQYSTLTTDKILAGVIDTIVKESPLLARLPFKEHTGNYFYFNIEDSMANVNWYTVGDTWTESANTWAQGGVLLTTMGGDVDTDKFAIKTKGDINDVRAVNIEGKAKAMAHEFDRAFILGQTTTTASTRELKGITKWIANYETTALTTADLDSGNNDQVILNDSTVGTEAVLSIAKLDEMIDEVRPGKPDCLMMSRRIRRYLNVIAYASASSPIRVAQDEFGKFVALYNEIPVIINDWIPDNLPDSTDDTNTTLTIASYAVATARSGSADRSLVYALKFDDNYGVCGIQNGAMEHEDLGELETKRAYRNRFAWDCGVVMLGKKCAAVLINAGDCA
jgi:hypothetical protein